MDERSFWIIEAFCIQNFKTPISVVWDQPKGPWIQSFNFYRGRRNNCIGLALEEGHTNLNVSNVLLPFWQSVTLSLSNFPCPLPGAAPEGAAWYNQLWRVINNKPFQFSNGRDSPRQRRTAARVEQRICSNFTKAANFSFLRVQPGRWLGPGLWCFIGVCLVMHYMIDVMTQNMESGKSMSKFCLSRAVVWDSDSDLEPSRHCRSSVWTWPAGPKYI